MLQLVTTLSCLNVLGFVEYPYSGQLTNTGSHVEPKLDISYTAFTGPTLPDPDETSQEDPDDTWLLLDNEELVDDGYVIEEEDLELVECVDDADQFFGAEYEDPWFMDGDFLNYYYQEKGYFYENEDSETPIDQLKSQVMLLLETGMWNVNRI